MNIYNVALKICNIESTALDIKQCLCTGSFLKGYNPKRVLTPEEEALLKERLAMLKRQVREISTLIGE